SPRRRREARRSGAQETRSQGRLRKATGRTPPLRQFRTPGARSARTLRSRPAPLRPRPGHADAQGSSGAGLPPEKGLPDPLLTAPRLAPDLAPTQPAEFAISKANFAK